VFSDTLLQLERAHLLHLAIWGAASVLAGTGVLAVLTAARARSSLLTHFAVQIAAWGAAELALAAWGWHVVGPSDLAGAVRLDRLLWFGAGLDVGIVAVGITLVAAGWRMGGGGLGPIGAGLGMVVQAAALFALDARLLALLAATR
jgi:uncharacterized protein DUF6992